MEIGRGRGKGIFRKLNGQNWVMEKKEQKVPRFLAFITGWMDLLIHSRNIK